MVSKGDSALDDTSKKKQHLFQEIKGKMQLYYENRLDKLHFRGFCTCIWKHVRNIEENMSYMYVDFAWICINH